LLLSGEMRILPGRDTEPGNSPGEKQRGTGRGDTYRGEGKVC